MTPHQPKRTKIFISYSHQDAAWLKRLRTHLRPLEREFGADIWDDRRIQSGAKWREEIQAALESAAAAILLVSADFLASDFIADNELPVLLKAAEDEGAVILPIILNHSSFVRHPVLSQFQTFNPPSRPLVAMSTSKQAEVLDQVAERVGQLLVSPPSVAERHAGLRDSAKAQSPRAKRRMAGAQPNVSRLQTGSDDGWQLPEDHPRQGRFPARKPLRTAHWLAIAVAALIVLAGSIVLLTRQFGGPSLGQAAVGPTGPARPGATQPRAGAGQAPRDSVNVTIENGGTARVFDESLMINLDRIQLDAGSNQYLVSFRVSSANFKEIGFINEQPGVGKVYSYPADGKFKIRLLSARENLADFVVEEMLN